MQEDWLGMEINTGYDSLILLDVKQNHIEQLRAIKP